MRQILTLLIVLFSLSLQAQKDCSVQPSSHTPLIDLQGQNYRGYLGGLYANGRNERPAAQLRTIQQQIAQVKPLNLQGQSDAKGKIVMIGVGASNPRTEFERFKQKAMAFAGINPNLVLVNTCIGGQGVQKMNDAADNYWQSAANTLKSSGLSDKQVQLAWVETDNTQTGDTLFPRAPLQLMEDYRLLLEVLHDKYPNLKLVYFSARAFSGYATPVPGGVGKGLLFPRDYYSGWAIKWLIDNADQQKPGFITTGTAANIPHITWGSYHWNNASLPRSDGFKLDCQTDVGEDGLHLTSLGEDKIGQLMFDYFQKDPTAQGWFLKATTTPTFSITNESPRIEIYPNPVAESLHLRVAQPLSGVTLTLRNLQGIRVWQKKSDLSTENEISDLPNLPAGVYLLECRWEQERRVLKVLKG